MRTFGWGFKIFFHEAGIIASSVRIAATYTIDITLTKIRE